jgi:hypothetical protein
MSVHFYLQSPKLELPAAQILSSSAASDDSI